MEKATTARYNEILCIGTGLAGVCVGVQLRRKYGFTDVHFYDRNESHSGTWQANRYPGCACDTPAIFYSYSFETNPEWTSLFPSKHEIKQYVEGIVSKYQLGPQMTFRTECECAIWDELRQIWSVHLRDLVTGECYTHQCRILFSAVGVLVNPKIPNIKGIDHFEGHVFHTARWRGDVDLRNKDVVVIGNGCSGTQVVPPLVHISKTVTQFINTPHWIAERKNTKIPSVGKWAFRNIPFLTRAVRGLMFLIAEYTWQLFLLNGAGERMRREGEKESRAFIRREAPEKYHETLIPDWEYACKRRIFDNDTTYLKSLHAPNFSLTRDPIVEIMSRGVRTANKTYSADAIVLATGFDASSSLGSFRVRGRNGEWLADHWKRMGGPGAYNGTALHGYPNFMIIYGPNATTGHNSVVFAIENQVKYAMQIIKPLVVGEAREFEVREGAEREWDERVQSASRNKLWTTCHNWYVQEGTKNSIMYPWTQMYLWWRATFPVWNDWEYKYTSLHARRVRKRRRFWLGMVGLGLSGVYVCRNYTLLEIHDMGKAVVWDIRGLFE